MGVFRGNSKVKLFLGEDRVKKAYLGETKLYSAGNIVTYYVDNGVTYQEEVDSDATCLAPSTFTPTKSGWTFVGWREDTTASADVLGSKVMGDEPVTLYAVFSKALVQTFYMANSTTTQTAYNYYNNGNIGKSTVTMPTFDDLSGWEPLGWSDNDPRAGASVAFSNGQTGVTVSIENKFYALYGQTVTNTFVSYGSTQYASGRRYCNASGNIANATVTAPVGASYSSWMWYGWSAANTTSAGIGASFADNQVMYDCTANATYYGLYYQTIYLYYNGNDATGGSTATQSGTRYYNAYGTYSNPTFTLASNGFTRGGYSFNGWNLGATGAGVTLSTSTTAYAQWTMVLPYTLLSNYYTYANDSYGRFAISAPTIIYGTLNSGNVYRAHETATADSDGDYNFTCSFKFTIYNYTSQAVVAVVSVSEDEYESTWATGGGNYTIPANSSVTVTCTGGGSGRTNVGETCRVSVRCDSIVIKSA